MDRDYMRRSTGGSNLLAGWQSKLAVAAAVIGVAGGALWLYRDARGLFGGSDATEGSLIVNINTATQEQLEAVPGLGPTRAAQVIAGRPYRTADELERISGIGPRQVASMRPFVTTEGDTRKRE